MKKSFSIDEAKSISAKIGKRLNHKGLTEFQKGLKVELEHGTEGPKEYGINTDVTGDDPVKTGKIALAHINEVPSYYTALGKMEGNEKKKHELKSIIKKNLKK